MARSRFSPTSGFDGACRSPAPHAVPSGARASACLRARQLFPRRWLILPLICFAISFRRN